MKHIIKQIEELIPVSNEPLNKFDLGYTKGLIEVLKILNRKRIMTYIPVLPNIKWNEADINRFADSQGLIATDCLKDDNEITLSSHEDTAPIFTFKRKRKNSRTFTMFVDAKRMGIDNAEIVTIM